MGKLNNAITKIRIKFNQWKKRRTLKHSDFTIISNNCWAGTAVYQPFGLKYNTPTVGLFIMDEDYIRFLENIESHIDETPIFIKPEDSKYFNSISDNGKKPITYPIATLGGDVEIHFLHYHSEEEALTKWCRRVKRINYDKLLVKMSIRYKDSDIESLMKRFANLPFHKKICFSPRPYTDPCIIEVPEINNLNLVGGDETDITLRHINLVSILNSI